MELEQEVSFQARNDAAVTDLIQDQQEMVGRAQALAIAQHGAHGVFNAGRIVAKNKYKCT